MGRQVPPDIQKRKYAHLIKKGQIILNQVVLIRKGIVIYPDNPVVTLAGNPIYDEITFTQAVIDAILN